jgi:hypothetical protein
LQVRNIQGIFCLPLTFYNVHSVTSNAVAQALSDKVKHIYLSSYRPSGNTVAEKLQTLLNEAYTSSQYEPNVSYVCGVEAGGYWYGFCTFTTFTINANYAEGIAICNSVLCRIMYSNGVWTVRQIV